MGMGSRVAGQDGMARVNCGSRLGWVGCKEEKAHTDLIGASSPHPNKCKSPPAAPCPRGPASSLPPLRIQGWWQVGTASVLPRRMGPFEWLCQVGAKLPEKSCIPLNSLPESPQTQANRSECAPWTQLTACMEQVPRSSLQLRLPCTLPLQAHAGPQPP